MHSPQNSKEQELLEALQGLPHGPEFRFIDRLTELVPGQSGSGEYTVPAAAPFLKGHFPGMPLMPGVLLLEAAAQIAGAVAQSDRNIPPVRELRLAGIRSARFYGTAAPGLTITLKARITARLGGAILADTEAFLGSSRIMAASLTLGGSDAKDG
jgi:3-hydroxyacyl-[acyl-carrier-protein] dehydratase